MRSSSSAASRIAFFMSLFWVAMNVHGCLCAPDGAVDAVRTASFYELLRDRFRAEHPDASSCIHFLKKRQSSLFHIVFRDSVMVVWVKRVLCFKFCGGIWVFVMI